MKTDRQVPLDTFDAKVLKEESPSVRGESPRRVSDSPAFDPESNTERGGKEEWRQKYKFRVFYFFSF